MFKVKIHPLAFAAVICTLLALSACKGCKKEAHKVTIPEKPLEAVVMRFEKDLFAIDTSLAERGLQELYHKYGDFYISYARDILAMPANPADPLFIRPMSMALSYQPFRMLQHSIDSTFGDLSDLKKQLGWTLAIYHQEFPEKRVPRFVTFFSEYGYANVMYDTLLGVGLDMYMKETQSDFYRALSFPEFRIRKLSREYIAPNLVKAMAIVNYENQTTRDKRFLATMIFEGKVLYFMKALLPDVHDSLITGYTTAQLAWCNDNRAEIWAHFIEKDLLYKDEPSQFMRYFNDGAFTSADGVPPESAPSIASWTGLQIVEKYMEEKPSTTFKELMEEKDFDKILKQSRYRPQ